MSSSAADEKKPNYKYYLKKLKRFEILISTCCIIGILLSLYALQVEIYKTKDRGYVAFCDINSWISCSKVFTSKYGKGFGLMPENSWLNQPNSIYGIIFFAIQLLLLLFRNNSKALRLKIFLSILANLGSVYLAGILYLVLRDFCIICVSSYIVNGILLAFNVKHLNYYTAYVEYNNSKKSRSK